MLLPSSLTNVQVLLYLKVEIVLSTVDEINCNNFLIGIAIPS